MVPLYAVVEKPSPKGYRLCGVAGIRAGPQPDYVWCSSSMPEIGEYIDTVNVHTRTRTCVTVQLCAPGRCTGIRRSTLRGEILEGFGCSGHHVM